MSSSCSISQRIVSWQGGLPGLATSGDAPSGTAAPSATHQGRRRAQIPYSAANAGKRKPPPLSVGVLDRLSAWVRTIPAGASICRWRQHPSVAKSTDRDHASQQPATPDRQRDPNPCSAPMWQPLGPIPFHYYMVPLGGLETDARLRTPPLYPLSYRGTSPSRTVKGRRPFLHLRPAIIPQSYLDSKWPSVYNGQQTPKARQGQPVLKQPRHPGAAPRAAPRKVR